MKAAAGKACAKYKKEGGQKTPVRMTDSQLLST
jgi:hypothetical protein